MIRYLLYIFLFFLYTISPLFIYSQTLTQNIRGRVIDKDTKVPLPGANIIVLNSSPLKGTVTDINGYFKIESVTIGRQSIKISYLGYEDIVLQEIEVSSARESYLNIELRESFIQSNEVVITASHLKESTVNEMALVSSRSFSVEETNKYAGSWGDPSRMAANFAGVSIVSDKRNDIIVRGNSPMSVLWKVDGVDIPNPNHFAVAGSSGGAISMINNNQLDNSDFHSGAFAAEYGNALSAVFDLKLRNGNNEKREYVLQAGASGFEAGAEGPFIKNRKASYLINYRYSTVAILDKAGISIIEAVPNFDDLSFKLNFPLKKGYISLFGIGGRSNANYKPEKNIAFLSDPANRWGYISGTKMGIVSVSLHHLLSNKTYFSLNIATSAYNPFDGSDSTGTDLKVNNIYYNAFKEYKKNINVIFNSKINNHNILRWGASFQNSQIYNDSYYYVYQPLVQKNTISSFDGNLSLAQAHFQWMHFLTPLLTVSGGGNFMQLFLNNKKCIEPRLALNWHFLPRHSLNAGFGIHHQTQPYAVYFLETVDSMGNLNFYNQSLDFSKSKHFLLGYNFKISNFNRLKIEAYYQDLKNIPVSSLNPYHSLINFATDDNIMSNAQLISEGEGYNTGIETTFERFLNKGLYYLFTASLFESKYKDGFNQYRNTRFNTNFLISLLAGKEIKITAHKNNILGFHGTFSYIGGQRYTPIDLGASKLKGQAVYIDSLSYSMQYPPFIKLDLKLRYRINKRKYAVEIALDVANVFNRKNVEFQRYDPYLQEIKEVYNLSRIPVALLKIEF
ncbi:MAG: TonB-dependent receptor [Bacteroidales bacterium]|nr:TonB-dependent receptor [Bacteroidales bacterium]